MGSGHKCVTNRKLGLEYAKLEKVVTSGSNAVFNEITSSGEVRFDGTGSFNSGIHLPDSKEISLGDGGNLKIYHNGANSYIHEGKGEDPRMYYTLLVLGC